MAELKPQQLYRRCDPAGFAFDTTEQLETLAQLFGQPRAVDSVEFGIGIGREGYNVFVMGPPGVGKHTFVKTALDRKVAGEPRPSDWAYVNNFADASRPLAIELPAGRGAALRDDMLVLVEELRGAIPAVFESDEYRARAGQIEAEFNERHEKAFDELGREAASQQIGLLRTPAGFTLAPVRNGEVLSTDDYARLSETERQRIERTIAELQGKLENLLQSVLRWRKEQRQRFKDLNREMTLFAVGPHISDLEARYHDLPRVVDYLEALQQDVIDHAEDFIRAREAQAALPVGGEPPSFRRYQVNLMVDHAGRDGSPIVQEEHPTYQNLVGRVDHVAQFGTLSTDFTLIRPGALHRANGGYLLLDAHKLLTQPYAWEGLKRALIARRVRIESLAEMYSLVSTVSLQPEPIRLDIKVLLLGDRLIYYLLHAYDPDFRELFKVVADFEERFERTPENDLLFARLVATVAREKRLAALDRAAVGRVIEHSARLAGDGRKLSANVEAMSDLLCEADYRAREAGHERISAADIERAIEAQRTRVDRVREEVYEAILRGTVLIDTSGVRAGQVNALSVMQLGDYAFAAPTRITATTRLGEGRVIDVQREVELGGAIHSKGVLILSAFLAARFAVNQPYSLTASLVFEQTYGTVEGDSASLAELCALLSSLAEAPIRQALAVTGSVNQAGEVQAVGAVNEKIEGFFDICRARALTGEQGVVIPAANVEHLMLRSDVIDAVAAGSFHVYAVSHVDQAIELLTGIPAGEADALGGFAADTINARVARRLRGMTSRRQQLATGEPARRVRGKPAKKR